MAIDVEALGPGHRIELYVKPDCPYCAQAEKFYRSKGLTYTKYNAQDDPSMKRRMLALSSGNPTTPAIVVDGTYIQSGWGKPPRG
jgi:glutaredoxin 3